MNGLFITGTDTGVGKTVLSLLLLRYFYEKGYQPFYVKPFQTGCVDPLAPDSDAQFIYSHTGPLQSRDPSESVLFCFRNPKAPWFAGRDMNTQVRLAPVRQFMQEKEQIFHPLIVEGAGGLLVPLTENLLVADAVKELGLRLILAARASLGTINHTLLSVEAAKKRAIEIAGIVFLDAGEIPTPADLLAENREAVERFSGIPVSGVIKHIRNFTNPGNDYIPVFDRMLNISKR